jgi:hypothetical protein
VISLNGGVRLSREGILRISKLHQKDLWAPCILMYIIAHADRENRFYRREKKAFEVFAEYIGRCRMTVYRSIRILLDEGLIESDNDNRDRWYTVSESLLIKPNPTKRSPTK